MPSHDEEFSSRVTEDDIGQPLPKIFTFCNGCHDRDWHNMTALSEDGEFLAGHVCSDHGFGPGDMGVTSSWKPWQRERKAEKEAEAKL